MPDGKGGGLGYGREDERTCGTWEWEWKGLKIGLSKMVQTYFAIIMNSLGKGPEEGENIFTNVIGF